MNKFPLLKGTSGLNDKFDSLRAPYVADSSVTSLTQADNVTLDLSGAIARRPGCTLLADGNVHSIFSCGDYGLCVRDGVLNLILGDLSLIPLLSVGNNKMAYVRSFDGMDDLVYFMNGTLAGIVRNGVYVPWLVPAYVGIKSTASKVRSFEPVIPSGQLVTIYNGRMFIAKGNQVYVSEPFAFSWFDTIRSFIFESRISMLRMVSGGIYVSTTDEIFFMVGDGPDNFSRVRVFNAGAVEGTDLEIPASQADVQAHGYAFFFACKGKGICAADNGGIITDHTGTFLNFPGGVIGSSYINDKRQFVVTILS